MNHLVFLFCLGSGLLALSNCQEVQEPGDVSIVNCTSNNLLDIHEGQNSTIVCETTNPQATIVWSIQRTGQQRTAVATCDPSNCTVHQPDHFAVQRSSSHSLLFYQQYDRDLDEVIICRSQFDGNRRTQSCKLNVINAATLSNCFVEIFFTIRGSCQFDQAYSLSRPFSCTWYMNNSNEQTVRVVGSITTTSKEGHLESGVCTFTQRRPLNPASYTYSILFYPGPEETTVDIITTDTGTPNSPTTTTEGERYSTVKGQATDDKGPRHTTSKPDSEEGNDLPVAAIAGGVAAAVALIIIVVVVVVVVRRKRRQEPNANAHWPKPDASKQNDDFEEHVNPMYTTSDDQDDTRHSGHNKPSAVALRIFANNKQQPPTAPPSLGANLYSSVDGEDTHNPYNTANGGYEDIGFDSNHISHTPETDDGYAVVEKLGSKPNPRSTASAVQSTHDNHEYAVVDKRGKNNAARNNASSPANANTAMDNGGTGTNNAGADVYAQVNKAGKMRKVVSASETQVDTYAQVQKPKPAAKPKIPAKPSSEKEADYPITADDDVYRRLNHSRGIPSTQSQVDVESHYSHIGHV